MRLSLTLLTLAACQPKFENESLLGPVPTDDTGVVTDTDVTTSDACEGFFQIDAQGSMGTCIRFVEDEAASPSDFPKTEFSSAQIETIETLVNPFSDCNAFAFSDFDNNGLEDLFIGCYTGPNELHSQVSNGQYELVTEQAGVSGMGFLNTYAAEFYTLPGSNLPTLFVANGNGSDEFYEQVQSGEFVESSDIYGLGDAGQSVAAKWFLATEESSPMLVVGRFDQGGLLYSTNAHTHNPLIYNEISHESGLLFSGLVSNVFVGDYNSDGLDDVLVERTNGQSTIFTNTSERMEIGG